jgi:hypothetical protein
MSPNLGLYIIHAITIIVLVVDLWLYWDRIPGNTWSQIIINKSKKDIYYPFLWGCLMGHWFL